MSETFKAIAARVRPFPTTALAAGEPMPDRYNLTPHFHVEEFDQPARHGQPRVPYPWEWIRERLLPLCQQLEVLRAHLGDGGGRAVKVVSGYRSPAYNKVIGGVRNSQHMQGIAADIVVPDMAADEVHKVCLGLYETGKLKIGGLGKYPTFVHLDLREGNRLARWTLGRTQI